MYTCVNNFTDSLSCLLLLPPLDGERVANILKNEVRRMLCPKCKIEAENKRDSQGNWSAFCRNPQCSDYGRVIKVILQNDGRGEERENGQ